MRQNTRNNFSKGSPILRCACRWPPLTIQPNYSSVMMTSKQPPTLLPPTQAQQPDVVELDTGQQEVNAQSLKARLMSQVFFVVVFVSLLLTLFVRLFLSLVSNVTKSRFH